MKQLLQLIFVTHLILYICSCKKLANNQVTANGVYVAGNIELNNPNDIRPVLFKDGVPTQLESGGWGSAYAVAINGNDVYVGGVAMLSDSFHYYPIIWKNGDVIVQQLPDSTLSGTVNDVQVNSTGVYACGSLYNQSTSRNTPVYWKNGTINILPGNNAIATSIFISGNDVYVGGYFMDTVGMLVYRPLIWKNGQIYYQNPSLQAQINSIFVSGSDVYAAGTITDSTSNNNGPAYWKNNVPTILNVDGGTANHIFVKNGDVYVSGSLYYTVTNSMVAMVWKNGTTTTLAGFGFPAQVQASAFLGNDFYSVGYRNNWTTSTITLWKNGQDSILYTGSGTPYDIAVQ